MNSTRLKFELIDPQTTDRALNPLAQLSSRLRREESAPRSQSRPRLVQDLAQGLDFLIGQLTSAEMDRDRAQAEADRWKTETARMRSEISDLQREVQTASEGSAEIRATRQTLEDVVAEQQKALLLSMELMRRFENEIQDLRSRVDAMESAPDPAETISGDTGADQLAERLETALHENAALADANRALEENIAQLQTALSATKEESSQALAEWNRKAEEKSGKAEETQRSELAALNSRLTAALEESARLREQLAEQTKLGDPAAAIRAIEEQRDMAKAEAASARADLSIQSAEIETKDALISALERALEQQHGSLRSLEQRFADYATRLQELRLDRLRMPAGGARSSLVPEESRISRLLGRFKRTFSPTHEVLAQTADSESARASKAPAADTEESE